MSKIVSFKIGLASCGIAAGGEAVLAELKKATTLPIVEVGCIGHCYAEPLIEACLDDGSSVMYGNVQPTAKAIENILSLGETGRFAVPAARKSKELVKVLALAGRISPVDFDDYTANGGYEGLKKALTMKPEEVIEEVKISGLRGRGGGGFPTGMKWGFLAAKPGFDKTVICNADEGDPGAFMDRSLMESVPHQVLEGMLIAAYATGASRLIIYCRAEYPMAIKHLKIAIEQIYAHKINVFSDREIEIFIKEGAGAFVCGEETALIASLEGQRGMPRFRPPFPTDSGYQGKPTMINNVETFGNIPLILRESGSEFAKIGSEGGRGTKLFALAGDLQYPGLVEVPMGTTLREIVFEIGGADPEHVKAVQTGGPSGGCIPVEMFDTPVDYDSLRSLGAIMGSGGLIVIGKDRCMVETARYFLDFTHRESCGKCTFCRVGTTRMFEILERIVAGKGTEADLDTLEDLGKKIKAGSLCGLGQTAPNPVLATLRYYRHEYLEHVNENKCRAMQCNALVDVQLDKSKCVKCKICIKTCPVAAISDDFVIDPAACTRCNSCLDSCPKKAIHRVAKGETL
ncbi:MAG: NADH-quinone oxidoreductase subunit F [Lentisphaerae bacterium]|nr:NADH-quinone oxidoreductase subunit F [Lentisphaerota bacterium]